jgi:hypothetical protein
MINSRQLIKDEARERAKEDVKAMGYTGTEPNPYIKKDWSTITPT